MTINSPTIPPVGKTTQPTRIRRVGGVTAFAVLSVFLLSGATSPTACPNQNIGPSTAEVVGIAVGAGAVIVVAILVPVEISKSHHTLTGCVSTGPGGLSLQTSDAKTYTLEGDPTAIKVGDMVKFHGSKVKKTKDSSGDRVFKVEQIKKDYGPCQVAAAHVSGAKP